MTYDNWKCTDPNDRYLGEMGEAEAWERFNDGEMSLAEFGEILVNNGHEPRQVRLMLTENRGYKIPIGYFGKE